MHSLPPLPKRIFLVVLCTICFVSQARAFSTGAGACLAGQASVFGLHLTNPTTGTLDQGGYTISIDSKTAQNGDQLSVSPDGLEFDIVVAGSKSFKGILVRVDGSTSDQVVPGTSSSGFLKAASCAGTGAVTHMNATPKTNVVATVSLDAPGKHDVDITLVVQNSGGVSEYYYSSVSVDVQEVAVTDAPSTEPSPMPTSPPSVEPSVSITPTKIPTNIPPKKDIPNDLSKDDSAKLFVDEERGNLQRKRRRLKSTQ